MRYLKHLYFTAAVIIFAVFAFQRWDGPSRQLFPYLLAVEGGIPNAVSVVYLKTRLYDTLFEVMVFSTSISGALYFLHNKSRFKLGEYLRVDAATAIMFRGAAFLSMIFGSALAFAGHLSPGGGFAAGVALGTSLVIQSLIKSDNGVLLLLTAERAEVLEKSTWLLILLVSIVSLSLSLPICWKWGSLFSGGWIPVLNVLIALKVGLGTWAIALGFLGHRWIF